MKRNRRQRVFPANEFAEEEIAAIEAEIRAAGLPEWWIDGESYPAAIRDPDWDKTNKQIH